VSVSLEEFLTTGVFAFMLVFVRFGTAIMIMPGIGDTFVPERIRLLIGLAISFAVFPILMPFLPKTVPSTMALLVMLSTELVVGILIGSMARIVMTALDTGGMIISFSSGLANAQLFNPGLAAQGSLVGAFLSITGVTVLFSLNLHHLLIMGLLGSYELFPLGVMPDEGSMAEIVARTVGMAFISGFQIASPFVVTVLLLYVGMGVLTRVMPQIQVFILMLPLQIVLSWITMIFVIGAIYAHWSGQFEEAMVFFLSSGQPVGR